MDGVTIRDIRSTDAEALSKLADNRNIWLNLRDIMPSPYSVFDAKNYIDIVQGQSPTKSKVIEHNGEFCGMIGIHPQTDIYRKSGEIGYWVGEPFWRKGIATRAISLMLPYGFEELELTRIYAGVFEHNKASVKVLEKNGFLFEGVSKKAIIKDGKVFDELRYAITN